MASVDTIALQIPADRRLARVVKAAVAVVARGAGIPEGRAATFAGAVARRFADMAGRNGSASRTVSVFLEPAPEGLAVRLDPGGGRRATILEVHVETARARAGSRAGTPRSHAKARAPARSATRRRRRV